MFVADIERVAAVRRDLAELVDSFDAGSLVAGDGARLVSEAAGITRLAHTLSLAGAAAVAEAGTWKGHGDRSKEDWLARTTGTTAGDAAGLFETGAAIAGLPKVAEAARRGTLSPAQLREVARAAAASPDAQDRLLQQAARGSLAELKDACKRTLAAADPDPEATERRIHSSRRATRHDQVDGTAVITLSGTRSQIGRMWAQATHRAEQVFKRARKEGRREPEAAYLFDAFGELLCSDTTDGPALPVGSGAKIIFRVDWAAAKRGHVEEGEVCELVGTGPVPVSVVREAAKDAFITAVVTEGTDIRLVTHLGRHPKVLQETCLQWSSPTCGVRGCNRTIRLETHHTIEWNLTKRTHVDFLGPRCSHHHDLETNHGYRSGPVGDDGKCDLLPPNPDFDRTSYVREADGTVTELVEALHEAVEATKRDRQRRLQPA